MNICVCSAVASFIFIYISSRRGDCTVTSRLAVSSITSSFIYNPLTALTVCVGVVELSPNARAGSPRYHRRFDFLESQDDCSLQPSLSQCSSALLLQLCFLSGETTECQSIFYLCWYAHSLFGLNIRPSFSDYKHCYVTPH